MQVITDYIRRSILTTRGDLVVRGVALPERLASGALRTFLAGQGVGGIPAWEGHKLSDHGMAVGHFARTSSGDEVITGLSFKSSFVIFIMTDGDATNLNWSIGFDYMTGYMVLFSYDGGNKIATDDQRSIYVRRSSGNTMSGLVTAFVNGGFTVTFVENGTSNATGIWLAIE